MNKSTVEFIDVATEVYGPRAVINRAQIDKLISEHNLAFPYWLIGRQEHREGRGLYRLPARNATPVQQTTVKEPEVAEVALGTVVSIRQPFVEENHKSIPSLFPGYVQFGFFRDMKKIIKSKEFFPIFVTGLSGNGKTLMVEQVCAELERECIRVNISVETDETDLLGGFQLIDGNTVFKDGPVLTAMRRGAILLIDEVDRGSEKLMCIQGILEGKPFYNKKTGELIHPAKGFNIVATANTKGMGSDEGKFLAQILDSAFLERFPITVEQEFPDNRTERNILSTATQDTDFIEKLCQFAEVVRKTYYEGAIDEVISTRRLVHIAKTYSIFNDRMKSITLCLNRFDEDTKVALLDLYTKIDVKVEPTANTVPVAPVETEKEVPF